MNEVPEFEFKGTPEDFARLSKPGIWIMHISSAYAQEIINQCNLDNRRIRQTHVANFVHLHKNDEWDGHHPQPIVFDTKGTLVDGQHRLLAIAQLNGGSAVPVRTITGSSVDRGSLDNGLPRGLADRVTFDHDFKANKLISETINFAIKLKQWSVGAEKFPWKKPSPKDAMQEFNAHRDAYLWSAQFSTLRAPVRYAAIEMYEIDSDSAERFCRDLAKENGELQQTRRFNEWLFRAKLRGYPAPLDVYSRAVYAMNAFLRKTPIQKALTGKWTVCRRESGLYDN